MASAITVLEGFGEKSAGIVWGLVVMVRTRLRCYGHIDIVFEAFILNDVL
jgi:hypothetical protein